MKLQEIEDRKNAIRAELARMDDDPNTTEEDHADLRDSLIFEYEQLDQRTAPIVERLQKLNLIQQEGRRSPANRESVDDGAQRAQNNSGNTGSGSSRTGVWGGGSTPDLVDGYLRRDPYEDLNAVRSRLVPRDVLRGRALDAIEMDARRYGLEHDKAETATRRAEQHPGVARHILLTGSRQYYDDYMEYLRNPEEFARSGRAINLTAASGGYLLPYVLDPTIVLTNASSANPFRRVSRVEQTTSNAWQGVSSAGVTAAWVAEAGTAADNSPVVGQIQIFPEKAVAWVYGSYESLDDTDFGTQLPRLLADARDRLESDAFATGSGHANNMPLGVLQAISGAGQRVGSFNTGTGATGTNFPVAQDVYATQAALPPRFRASSKAGWMANLVYINKLRAIDTAGGSSFWANFGSDTPEQLLGKPIYEASSFTSSTATGTGTAAAALVYGDWEQFVIVDRIGVSMLYEPMVKGTAGSIPTGQAGWYMFWRTSSGVSTPSAFRYLTVG